MESFSVHSRADFSSCGRMQGGTGAPCRLADEIMDEWSQQFLKLAKIAEDEAIRDSRAYKLKPW